MANTINYDSENGLWGRFISHAQLGLSKEVQPHQVNVAELLGDLILWTAEDLPRHVWNRLTAPRVVTVALTSLALLANSFLFYPTTTWLKTKAFVKALPLPPAWAVRFGSYIYTSALILGYGLRAFGRFSNPNLMQAFYNPSPKTV